MNPPVSTETISRFFSLSLLPLLEITVQMTHTDMKVSHIFCDYTDRSENISSLCTPATFCRGVHTMHKSNETVSQTLLANYCSNYVFMASHFLIYTKRLSSAFRSCRALRQWNVAGVRKVPGNVPSDICTYCTCIRWNIMFKSVRCANAIKNDKNRSIFAWISSPLPS